MSASNLSLEAREDKAAELGLMVIEPVGRELFVDLDGEAATIHMTEMIRVACETGFELTLVASWNSRTPGHQHAIVIAPHDLDVFERIALQAALGSDRKRELLSVVVNTVIGRETACFFETPERCGFIAQKRATFWNVPKPAPNYDDDFDALLY